ncbi:MAG: hypothetical protein AAB049_05135 [Nitrospirota bacterium]
MMKISKMTAQSIVHGLIRIAGIVALVSLPVLPSLGLAQENAPAKPKTPRMTCGKCEEGYVTTGRTTDANICKEDDHALVSCLPVGSQAQMPVCGSCPEGYLEMGRSLVPALCGNEDNGLRTQCQLPKMEGGMPDPTQGGRRCPPDCGKGATGTAPADIPQPGKALSVPETK